MTRDETFGELYAAVRGEDWIGLRVTPDQRERLFASLNGLQMVPKDVGAVAEAMESVISILHPDDINWYRAACDLDRQVNHLGRSLEIAQATLDSAVSKASEPLRQLGEYLARVLDEDQWATAERFLNAAAIRAFSPAAREDEFGQLYEARTDISNLRTQIMMELDRGVERWEGVPDKLKERLAEIDRVLVGEIEQTRAEQP